MDLPRRDGRDPFARLEFLDLYLEDLDAGRVRSLAEYQARFRQHASLIAREYELLQSIPASAAQAPRLDPTERLGRYRIERELGRGGQGVVYLATDTELDRRVALKLLSGLGAWSPAALERFKREASAASRIDHPGVCTVYDAGSFEGIPYLAMRYVPGRTLAERIATDERGAADRERVHAWLLLFEKIARALHAAHEAGIVHRDIKPGNLMVGPDGDPVVLDFGLARHTDGSQQTLTITGDRFGTPAYMSPEQLQLDSRELDRRTDVYSLGVCLFEVLTGRRPFEAPTLEALYRSILDSPPPDLRRHAPAVGRELKTVVDTALEKAPERRYRDAAALADDLRAVADGRPIAAARVSTATRLVRWARRRPAHAALAMVAGLGVPAAVGFAAYLVPQARSWREIELAERVERALQEALAKLATGPAGPALAAFEAARELAPDRPELLAGTMLAKLRTGDLDAVATLLAERRAVLSEYAAFDRIRAVLAQRQGKTGDTTAVEATRRAPKTALDHFLTGFVITELLPSGTPDAFREPLAHFTKAVMLAPRARLVYHGLRGRAAAELHDNAQARAAADALEQLWPDSPQAWFWISQATVHADPARCVAYARKYLPVLDMGPRPYIVMAVALASMGDVDRAIAACLEGLEKYPDTAELHNNAALYMISHAAHRQSALRHAERAVELEPKLPGIRFGLGCVRAALGDQAGAIAAYRETIAMAPRFKEAHLNLGAALDRTGDRAAAERAYRAAQEIAPKWPVPYANLSALCLAQQDWRGALRHAERALALGGDDAATRLNQGVALNRLGRHEEAKIALRAAVAGRQRDPAAHRELSTACAATGDVEALRHELERWTAANPQSALAWEELARFHVHPEGQPGQFDPKAGMEAARKAAALLDKAKDATRFLVSVTLAEAQHANGDSRAAVETVRSVLPLAPNARMAARAREFLRRYEAANRR